MIGIYMSGTGNTKHCVSKLLSVIDPKAEMIPIESEESADKIRQSDMVFIHDANTETRKAELFGKVRSGQVRFFIGINAEDGSRYECAGQAYRLASS